MGWSELFQDNVTAAGNYTIYLIDHGLSVCDTTGLRFQDFIVGLLRHRKANIRKPPPRIYWDPVYIAF